MQAQLETLRTWLNGKTLRERAMVCGLTIISVVMFIYVGIIEPTLVTSKKLNTKIIELKQQSSMSELELVEQQQQAINKQAEQEKASLLAEQQELDKKLNVLAIHFMPAIEVTGMLKQLLSQQTQLTLVRLENKPAVSLANPLQIEKSAAQKSDLIYRHALVVELQGGYAATVNFLEAVEALKWGFMWEKMEYQVTTYPAGKVILEIYYLSKSEQWMGV